MARVSSNYVVICEPNRKNPFVMINSLKNREWCMFNFSLSKLLKKIKNLQLIKKESFGFISYKQIPKKLIHLLMTQIL